MGDLGRWLLGRGGLSQDLFEDAGGEILQPIIPKGPGVDSSLRHYSPHPPGNFYLLGGGDWSGLAVCTEIGRAWSSFGCR